MAQIRPFAALRYDLARVHANDVLTQPYDKITPAMRQRYLELSPYNLVRVILGEKHADDSETSNVYTRAAGYLEQWSEAGILRSDPVPGIYAYTQTFVSPDTRETLTRRAFIALGRLEDYDNHVVYRHEQTLSGPKLDRQALLRATHTHLGQIFMMYSDPAQTVERELLDRARTPVLEATDEYGTIHRLYAETDAGVLDRLQRAMADRPLIIADGHHRYETALQWRNEQSARASHRADPPWNWVMMTFVNLDAPGLVVLPTHRLVHGLAAWDAAAVLDKLQRYFDVSDSGLRFAGSDQNAAQAVWNRLRPQLVAAGAAGPAMAVLLGSDHRLCLLRPKPALDLTQLLPDALPEQRRLDVLLLHRLGLDAALGITAEAVREERNLRYVRDATEALQAVGAGAAQAAFFLNPIPPALVRDVALAGGVMPQKATDFYPKMLTGLTLYRAS